jgi:2-succinyl-5-enolpyruvyl-6-hydroxy-3-cyclohexene-1-carboxylate synthase
MFREPFEVSDTPLDLSAYPRRCTRTSPVPRVEINVPGGDTLVVVGGCRRDEALAARRLAERLGVPLLSDICSGLRHISTELPADRELPTPGTVIHVGGRIVSKSWHGRLAEYAAHVIHLTSNRNRLDPYHMGIERVLTPLAGIHESVSLSTPSSKSFFVSWEQAERRRRGAIEAVLANELQLSEPSVAFALAPRIPLGQGLFIGNSLPIRDFDRYAHWDPERYISVGANRGASGIDGLIATSVGFAMGLRSPTTVVVGDLSALHDLNSLALVQQSEVPIIVVIMNNHGGGIFDLLPVAQQTNHFERFFTTPHQLSFSHVASMFDIAYERPRDMPGFLESYQRAVASNSSTIIEVVTDRAYNVKLRQGIHAEISQ